MRRGALRDCEREQCGRARGDSRVISCDRALLCICVLPRADFVFCGFLFVLLVLRGGF